MENSAEKRHSERIETSSVPDVQLFIQGVARALINIGNNGFGILIDTPKGFHLGQRIGDIRLDMGDTMHRLHGVVTHITRTKTDYILGIRLELNSIEQYRVVADLKKRCAARN